jgi:hypothetical protein
MTNPPQPRRPLNPEQAIPFLSDHLRTRLALIHRNADDLEPCLLASLPRGSRLLLDSLGALGPGPGDPSEFVLTAFGRELASSCAIAGLSAEVQQTLAALEQERARRAASGEDRSKAEAECVQGGEERR